MKNTINEVKLFFDRHNGLQRNNRFSLSFQGLPSGLPSVNPDDFKVKMVDMSSRAIDAVADNLVGYGDGRLVPRSQKFVGGVLLTFAVTNDNFIIDFFNKWYNLIYSGGRIQGNQSTPFVLNYYNNIIYNTNMEIQLLDPNGNVNKTFTFYEVYPLENIPLELNMLRPNEYLVFQVLMNYREFTIK